MDEAVARLYDQLPTYYGDRDEPVPEIERWLRACSGEVELARGRLQRLRDGVAPIAITDEFGLLSRWERLLKLPVRPPGTGETARRNAVMGKLRGRRVAEGRQWTDAITQGIGTNGWSHRENTPEGFDLLIELPFPSGSYQAQQAYILILQITPAHLSIGISHLGGFLVGISRVGIDTI